MKKFFFDSGTRDAVTSTSFLFLRLSFALMMLIGHGIPKIQNYAHLTTTFKAPDLPPFNLMSTQVSLIAVILAEVAGSAMIILGLMTRPAAFALAFTMVVAAFGKHGLDPWFAPPAGGGAKELAVLYIIPAIAILLSGAGLYSVDALVPTDKKRRKW